MFETPGHRLFGFCHPTMTPTDQKATAYSGDCRRPTLEVNTLRRGQLMIIGLPAGAGIATSRTCRVAQLTKRYEYGQTLRLTPHETCPISRKWLGLLSAWLETYSVSPVPFHSSIWSKKNNDISPAFTWTASRGSKRRVWGRTQAQAHSADTVFFHSIRSILLALSVGSVARCSAGTNQTGWISFDV